MMPEDRAVLCYRAFDRDPGPARDFIAFAATEAGLSGPLRILDMGCGPGRMLGEFRRLGWSVDAYEPHPAFCAAAAALAQGMEGVHVRRGGFADLIADGEYDVIVALNGSFQHLLTAAEREDAGDRLFRALRPGGLVFLDAGNFPYLLAHYRSPEREAAPSPLGVVEREPSHGLDWQECTWTHTDRFTIHTPEGDERVEIVHRYFMLSFPEVERVLTRAGFSAIRTYNSYASRVPERLTGPRMLVTARRPRSG